MIARREFITLVGCVTAAWPVAARAHQQDERARALLLRILQLRADSLADKISQILDEIIRQIGWTTQLPWSVGTMDQRQFDALRLLRQTIPVSEVAFLDASGIEQLKVWRPGMVASTKADRSQDPRFTQALAHAVYFGPVYPLRDTLYMTLALAGTRREAGVTVAELSLSLEQFVWRAKVGEHGVTYILDADGRVIVHSEMLAAAGAANRAALADLSLFQRDFSGLAQVQAVLAPGLRVTQARVARDINGREVLSASAIIDGPSWHVFVELPLAEADTAVP